MPSWVKVQIQDLKLVIGSYEPMEHAEQLDWLHLNCDAVINVSDFPCLSFCLLGPKSLWFPIDEKVRWPIASLFGVKRALDMHIDTLHSRTFVHCAGGINRSRTAVALWLYSRGEDAERACAAVGLREDWIDHLLDKGLLTEHDLKILLMADKSTYSLMGIRQYVDGEGQIDS